MYVCLIRIPQVVSVSTFIITITNTVITINTIITIAVINIIAVIVIVASTNTCSHALSHKACPAGKFSLGAATECTTCPAAYYQSQDGVYCVGR